MPMFSHLLSFKWKSAGKGLYMYICIHVHIYIYIYVIYIDVILFFGGGGGADTLKLGAWFEILPTPHTNKQSWLVTLTWSWKLENNFSLKRQQDEQLITAASLKTRSDIGWIKIIRNGKLINKHIFFWLSRLVIIFSFWFAKLVAYYFLFVLLWW